MNADQQTSLDWPGLGGVPVNPAVTSFDPLLRFTIKSISKPSALVGQSMGGFVAAHVVIARPDLVTHLILAATSAGIDRVALGLPEWSPRLQPGDSDTADWVTTRHPPLDDQLRTLDIPALLIWATHDPISPLAIGERLHEFITGSKLVAYDSDDHWVARVRSDEVADEINQFFDTTSG